MNAKAFLFVFAVAFLPLLASAQGFAGLGQSSDGFALPDPDTRFSFPDDHGPHPNFRIEWWYVTANLRDKDGVDYGVQWTLFRNAMTPSGTDADQIWMGHAAVSGPDGHYFDERFSRGGSGTAGVSSEPFEAFIDEWVMTGSDPNNVRLHAQGSDFSYDLSLQASNEFVPQGANGFSAKSHEGLASHYYSQPFYKISGTVILPSGEISVTGRGWLDREWSSQPLSPTQTGWDWISLHLDGGDKMMGYRLRDETGPAYTVGTWISRDGTPTPFVPGELTMTPIEWASVADRDVPVGWRVTLPKRDLAIQVEAIYPQSWMSTAVPYWEGPVSFDGTHKGIGYLEMTGYE